MTSTTTRPLKTSGDTPRRRDSAPNRAGSRRRAVGRAFPLGPAIALLAVFLLGPVIWSVYGSLTSAALTGPGAANPEFIGFENYTTLLTDPDFPNALLLTVIFLLASAVLGQNLLGLSLAILMAQAPKVIRSFVGTTVVAAWVLPEIVAAFACYAFFSKDGTLNAILGIAGVEGPNWLFAFPMFAVILANIWRGTAFSMMIYEAALNDVAPEITEAAVIDGAGGWKRLIFVTLPVIRNSISTNLMLITLQTLSVFTLIFVMTSGGPNQNSTTLPLFAYFEAFGLGKVGYGTAIATVMLLIGAVFSLIYIRVLKPGKD